MMMSRRWLLPSLTGIGSRFECIYSINTLNEWMCTCTLLANDAVLQYPQKCPMPNSAAVYALSMVKCLMEPRMLQWIYDSLCWPTVPPRYPYIRAHLAILPTIHRFNGPSVGFFTQMAPRPLSEQTFSLNLQNFVLPPISRSKDKKRACLGLKPSKQQNWSFKKGHCWLCHCLQRNVKRISANHDQSAVEEKVALR